MVHIIFINQQQAAVVLFQFASPFDHLDEPGASVQQVQPVGWRVFAKQFGCTQFFVQLKKLEHPFPVHKSPPYRALSRNRCRTGLGFRHCPRGEVQQPVLIAAIDTSPFAYPSFLAARRHTTSGQLEQPIEMTVPRVRVGALCFGGRNLEPMCTGPHMTEQSV
jgi:hypothetical protein